MLCEHYKWPPDFWKTMGWGTFWAWLRERNRSIRAQNEAGKASPHSWRGRAQDPFWTEQDAKRKQIRGW